MSSPDFPQREVAQNELEQATWRDYETLHRIAAGVTDPEALARLGPRMETLAAQAALNPPPISVQLVNASLADVAKALAATPEFRVLASQSNVPVRTITANIADRSLWQILDEVNTQIPLRLGDSNHQLSLGAADFPLQQLTMTEYPAVAAYPGQVELWKWADIQQNDGRVQTLHTFNFKFSVCIDRRVPLTRPPALEILSAVDNRGNELIDKKALGTAIREDPQPFVYHNAAELRVVEGMGDTLAKVKGQVTLTVDIDFIERDLEKELPVDTPIVVGSTTLTVTKFAVYDGATPSLGATVQVFMSWAPPPPPAGARRGGEGGFGTPRPPRNPTLAIFDSHDHLLGKQVVPIGQWSEVRLSVSKLADSVPLKFRLSLPAKSKAVAIPFTFHDLPLPK